MDQRYADQKLAALGVGARASYRPDRAELSLGLAQPANRWWFTRCWGPARPSCCFRHSARSPAERRCGRWRQVWSTSGFTCTLVDWPGFGSSTRGPTRIRSRILSSLPRRLRSGEYALGRRGDCRPGTPAATRCILDMSAQASGGGSRFRRRPGEDPPFRPPWGRTRQSMLRCARSSAPRSSARRSTG